VIIMSMLTGISSTLVIPQKQSAFAARGDGGGNGHHHHRSDSRRITNDLPTSEPSPELTLGPATEPEPLDCTKNLDDILCKVDCTTNPDDPLCTPPSPPPQNIVTYNTSLADIPEVGSEAET
jgi:hypothetical protein